MRKIIALSIAATAIFGLSACSAAANVDHSGHPSQSATADFSSADLMFAQMMIPHHQQAVDISFMALANTQNADVRALAESIITHQSTEVVTMKSWLDAAGVSLDDSHSMHMQGMLTEAQLAELEAAKDAEFDALWLEGMIMHHEGAIVANAEVADFAEHVIEDQTGEIAKMKDLLG
ncbi:MAG: hypothetical protein RI919_764 [Actinomycetota bacterium]